MRGLRPILYNAFSFPQPQAIGGVAGPCHRFLKFWLIKQVSDKPDNLVFWYHRTMRQFERISELAHRQFDYGLTNHSFDR